MAYYNENDAPTATWLDELVRTGAIPAGTVDTRSIAEVRGSDVGGGQAHFFAGIGGWAHALSLAGVDSAIPAWTGSCPCQPFSVAGRGLGIADPRHLWPVWFGLIDQCKPPIIFGEQVASPAGRAWLAAVRSDLENLGYAVAAADLCAAGVGAPHIRQRLYWVAYRNGARLERWCSSRGSADKRAARADGVVSGVADAVRAGWPERWTGTGVRPTAWSSVNYLPCTDGKSRPAQPGILPLAHGVSGRMGLLRGYGNAIVPQVAAAFIVSALEALQELGGS